MTAVYIPVGVRKDGSTYNIGAYSTYEKAKEMGAKELAYDYCDGVHVETWEVDA